MSQNKLNKQTDDKNLENKVDGNVKVEPASNSGNSGVETRLHTPDICPACHNKMQRYNMGSLEAYDIYSCQLCGSLFLDPPVQRRDVDNFYSDLDPEVVHIANHEKRIKALRKLIDKIVVKPEGKTFLSINTLQGYAVEAAKDFRFKEIRGIDRYDFFVDFAKRNYGEKYFEAISVEEYAERGETANIVVSIESFSTQVDTEKHMQAIAKIMKPGSILYIEEVDGNSHFLPNDLTRWAYLQPPITTNFISEKAMRSLLERNGFKVKKKFFNWGIMMKLVAVKVK